MLIRGPIINGNALNNDIARRLRAGSDVPKPNRDHDIIPNTPAPKDVVVMITDDARMRYREGQPTK